MIERKVNGTGFYRKIHQYETYTKNQNKPKIAHSKPLNTNVALLKFKKSSSGWRPRVVIHYIKRFLIKIL